MGRFVDDRIVRRLIGDEHFPFRRRIAKQAGMEVAFDIWARTDCEVEKPMSKPFRALETETLPVSFDVGAPGNIVEGFQTGFPLCQLAFR